MRTKPPTYQLVIAWIIAAYLVSKGLQELLSPSLTASSSNRVLLMFWPLLSVGFCSWQTALWRASRARRDRHTSDVP